MNFEISSLKEIDSNCIILDIKEINPIEILVVTDKAEQMDDFLNQRSNSDFFEGNIRRIVRTYSVKKIKIKRATDVIANLVQELGNEAACWPREDLTALLQYYYLFSKENLVKKLISLYLSIDEKDEAKVLSQFVDYLSVRNILIDTKKIKRETLGKRITHRVVLDKISWQVRFHNLFTRKKFLSFAADKFKSDDGKLLNLSKKSGTDCVLLKQLTANGDYFIKGNAPKVCSLKYEIEAQKRIATSYPKCARFVTFVECDPQNDWITYRFEEGVSLRDYCRRSSIKTEALCNLGEFLVDIVSKLKKINIIHSDIRPENIMVCGPKGTEEFKLIDFGGATIDEKVQWQGKTDIDNYYRQIIGGRYRYDNVVIDDAASALLTYLEVGGKLSDRFGQLLLNEIGVYYVQV